MGKAQIGLIGLAVMGANLSRNIARHFPTVVFNRTTEKMEEFIKEFGNENLTGEAELTKFVQKIDRPRKIIIMVKAGPAIDAVIAQIIPLLEEGDIIMDGGNSHYKDTIRREKELREHSIKFIGMGISGGEEGALNGPSIMPGGEEKAYKCVEKILQQSAADDGIGGKCVTHIGKGASGHFVKMVHNGIEYGIMQLIAESYDLLKNIGAYTNEELAQTFKEWETTENLQSFLIEITAEIFKQKDTETEKNLIDLIKDAAKQKGTGKWTSEAAFEYGVATPTINAAVDARIISGSTVSRNTGKNFPTTLDSSIQIPEQEKLKEIVKNALILSTIVTYYQGFELMHTASHEHEWYLNLSEIARIWRGGCIIRSDFLEKLQKAMRMNKENQMDTQLAKMEILNTFSGEEQSDWRKTVVLGATQGIPLPSINASLSYFDSLRREKLPQNLTQAQRDFFGAHTYERIDKDGTFHTEWQ